MPAAIRQSAFAKRRRLNDGTPTSATDSEPVPTPKSTKTTVTEKKIIKAPSTVTRSTSVKVSSNVLVAEVDEENAFGALVEADVVKFSGTREIEWLDANTAKIRLSRGQRCSLEGVARLWIRDGIVNTCGASLRASPSSLQIYAPDFDAPVIIEAESKVAELQLESVASADKLLPSTAHIPGCSGSYEEGHSSSFRLTDGDLDVQINSPRPAHLAIQEHKGKALGSRLLVYGRKPIETLRTARQLLNQCLSDASDRNEGVLLLDLDADNPMFGCPGTVSIFDIHHFVTGPPYAYPTLPQSQDLLESFYIGPATSEDAAQPCHEILDSLLQSMNGRQNATLVVRPGAWFGRASDAEIQQLCKVLKIDTIISVDRSKSISDHDAVRRLSTSLPISFIHAPPSITNTTSTLAMHQKTLQSHFRFFGTSDGLPLWFGQVIPRNVFRTLDLSYGSSSGSVQDLFVYGGTLRESDIAEVLDKALVMVVFTRSQNHNDQVEHSALTVRNLTAEFILSPIGLALIEQVDEVSKILRLNSPVVSQITQHQQEGHRLGLVLVKPDDDGRNGRNLLAD